MMLILKNKLNSTKRTVGLLKRVANIKDIPDSLYLKGDGMINKRKNFKPNSLFCSNHFRRSNLEIKNKRIQVQDKIKKDYPNINTMPYEELMTKILFGGLKHENKINKR